MYCTDKVQTNDILLFTATKHDISYVYMKLTSSSSDRFGTGPAGQTKVMSLKIVKTRQTDRENSV